MDDFKKKFEHTHYHFFGWESDLVEAIYYNENEQRLLVVLHGGRVYGYNNVNLVRYENFTKTTSAGTFYNNSIKRERSVTSDGFVAYSNEILAVNLKELAKMTNKQDYEVTVQVTLTTTVRVTAENFDSAAQLAMDEVEKIQGANTDVVSVTGVKKL